MFFFSGESGEIATNAEYEKDYLDFQDEVCAIHNLLCSANLFPRSNPGKWKVVIKLVQIFISSFKLKKIN